MKSPVSIVVVPFLFLACGSLEPPLDRLGGSTPPASTGNAGPGTPTGTAVPPSSTGGPNGAPTPSPGVAPPCGQRCDDIPQCEFLCPEGTSNPTDQNGCVHTCKCVAGSGSGTADAGTTTPALRLFGTCGDPVCGIRPHGDPAVPACTGAQIEGAACGSAGWRCDPCPGCTSDRGCNQFLVCAAEDPRLGVGGCPISRSTYKRDIRYLDDRELGRYEADLLGLRLATWRYKSDPSRARLGFIIDDLDARASSVAVEGTGDRVDLYGYTSLAVATLQRQARQIAGLQRELADLRRAVRQRH
jgi:hypothetical protein